MCLSARRVYGDFLYELLFHRLIGARHIQYFGASIVRNFRFLGRGLAGGASGMRHDWVLWRSRLRRPGATYQ
jgi:hypothetical protein